jgi:BASS family bile acid:Na+ symporter
MAIAPGVPFVLLGVRKKGGSMGLAVALALFLPLLSIVTVPITAALVLPAQAEAQLPLAKFAITLLLFQALPLLLGIAVAGRFPALAPRLQRISTIIFLVALVVLLIVLARRLVSDIATVYGSRGMLAMLCLIILSVVTGWLLGGPAEENRHTLSIGTALRNIGFCATIATASFPGTPVASAVLAYLLVQILVTSLVGMYFKRSVERAAA